VLVSKDGGDSDECPWPLDLSDQPYEVGSSVTSQITCVFFGFFSSDKSMTSAQADNFDQNGRMNIN
jgi:hypothetical protein